MAPQKKTISQTAASTVVSKRKKIIDGSMGPTDLHPSNPDVILEQFNKELSPATTTPEQAANEHESRLPTEGKFFQMLTRMQKRLDEQEAEAVCERKKSP